MTDGEVVLTTEAETECCHCYDNEWTLKNKGVNDELYKSVNIVKTIELFTFNGWIALPINHILMKLFKKRKR